MSTGKSEKRLSIPVTSVGVLFLSFFITVLISPGIGPVQRNIAYAYAILSAILGILALVPSSATSAVWAHLPSKLRVALRSPITLLIFSLVSVAWVFTFADKWLSGLEDTTHTMDQLLVEYTGIFWLLVLAMVFTRTITRLTESYRKPLRWISLLIPLAILCLAVTSLLQDDPLEAAVLALFIIGTTLVALRKWTPPGGMPFLEGLFTSH